MASDWELIEEYATPGSRTAAYLQGASGVIKSWGANGTFYYYRDKLGSTTHIANASGTLLESYRYDLYGTPSYFNAINNQLSTSNYSVNDLYAGERWIPELAAYDLRNRFMSPELGRFLQADPIGFKGDGSNLYRYCHNDPEDFSDPMGLYSVDPRYSSLTSMGGGDWVKGSDGLSAWDWNHGMGSIRPQAGMDGGGGGSALDGGDAGPGSGGRSMGREHEGRKEQSPQEQALDMLRGEARGMNDKTGEIVLQNGQIRHASPVEGHYVQNAPFDPAQGHKMERENLGTGGRALWIVHYHFRGGSERNPTPDDFQTMKNEHAPMMFTSKELAREGHYQIFRSESIKPLTLYDRQLYLEHHNE